MSKTRYWREENAVGQFQYGVMKINEEFFEDVIVEHLVEELEYHFSKLLYFFLHELAALIKYLLF